MKITILAVGKVKDEWLRLGINEYRKRISRFSILEIIEISDSPDTMDIRKGTRIEGEKILSNIREKDYVITLELEGKPYDSVELSNQLNQWLEIGKASIIFIIGGSNGLSPEVCERANEQISLSRLTFPHQMTRLVLMEQLFRSFKISKGERYHK